MAQRDVLWEALPRAHGAHRDGEGGTERPGARRLSSVASEPVLAMAKVEEVPVARASGASRAGRSSPVPSSVAEELPWAVQLLQLKLHEMQGGVADVYGQMCGETRSSLASQGDRLTEIHLTLTLGRPFSPTTKGTNE
eukprot:g20461.t1